jgi:hypothetical protein
MANCANSTTASAAQQPTCRALLGAAALLPAVAAIPTAATAEDHRWADLKQRLDVLDREGRELDARRGVTDEEFEVWSDRFNVLLREIELTPARTLESLRVKALAIRGCGGGEIKLSVDSRPTTDVRIAQGLINDLLGMGAI